MTQEQPRVTIVDHPMVQHKLSILRDRETSSKQFRELVKELALFEGYEATR
ncbi:MAG: uracil phosphoribosyltransferase, partial [Raoultibacter sp.]